MAVVAGMSYGDSPAMCAQPHGGVYGVERGVNVADVLLFKMSFLNK